VDAQFTAIDGTFYYNIFYVSVIIFIVNAILLGSVSSWASTCQKAVFSVGDWQYREFFSTFTIPRFTSYIGILTDSGFIYLTVILHGANVFRRFDDSLSMGSVYSGSALLVLNLMLKVYSSRSFLSQCCRKICFLCGCCGSDEEVEATNVQPHAAVAALTDASNNSQIPQAPDDTIALPDSSIESSVLKVELGSKVNESSAVVGIGGGEIQMADVASVSVQSVVSTHALDDSSSSHPHRAHLDPHSVNLSSNPLFQGQ
jgi:hypothetical protein